MRKNWTLLKNSELILHPLMQQIFRNLHHEQKKSRIFKFIKFFFDIVQVKKVFTFILSNKKWRKKGGEFSPWGELNLRLRKLLRQMLGRSRRGKGSALSVEL